MPAIVILALSALVALLAVPARTPAERGREALTGTAFIKGFWPRSAYDNAWRLWGLERKPDDYDAASAAVAPNP